MSDSTARTNHERLLEFLQPVPVIPVITIRRLEDAIPLAEALVAGGIRYLEITLRSPIARKAAETIARNVPQAIVGIGTVLTPQDLVDAANIGAQFALSPGATQKLLEAASDSPLPFIPGVTTASEIMAAEEYGFFLLKFFPASALGGKAALRAFQGPFPDVVFCPTGGITAENFLEWRALPNVVTVGGSWLTPETLIDDHNWPAITHLARNALAALNSVQAVLF